MDFSEPLFKDSKFKEILSKLSQLEKNQFQYISLEITEADLSKIQIPTYVRELAIEFCEDEATIINMILRSFVVEQLEGDKVNYKRLFNVLKQFCTENNVSFDKLSKYISTNY